MNISSLGYMILLFCTLLMIALGFFPNVEKEVYLALASTGVIVSLIAMVTEYFLQNKDRE